MSAQRERAEVTFVVDGVEVTAPEGTMLVDAAKLGDIEIPVFCYEPKLGEPVGACRMCLVEIEGIPKLQTACSTPVRDGMVVYTQTDPVRTAQNAVVEFLLVNHPLDCPVCDKGGECPLQDIAMGWGPGRSRFTDPKRHFQKPVPLSPLVRIDRERCILCYRCVRFSQEVAEDEQLQLLERGARTFVGTYDDRPYIAPFHGNVIELCPVGALTSEAYRFRARPWDIEDAGSVCTLCPSQCNVRFTVRDERVTRVLARDNRAVDDGWLCDKGRFGFQMITSEDRITEPLVREAGDLRPASWEEALGRAADGLSEAGSRTGAILGGESSNEEGYLTQRLLRRALGSPHIDSRSRGELSRVLLAAAGAPGLAASVADLDAAESILLIDCDPLHAMPILDLRIRKAVRREGVRLAVASERPTALDGGATEVVRYAPGEAGRFLAALAGALGGRESGDAGELQSDAVRIAGELRPRRTVVVWGERLASGGGGDGAVAALLDCAERLELSDGAGGLIEVPEESNGRGLREVGCLPDAGPGLAPAAPGRGAAGIREGLESRELSAVLLVGSDPVRNHRDGPGWQRALAAAHFVVAVAAFHNGSTAHANVVLPAEAYAEKEGTVTHPDGRLQRLRPGVPHPGQVRPTWQALVELSSLLGEETGLDSAPEVLAAIASEVPFYGGLSHGVIGGKGARWQERDAAGAHPASSGGDSPPATSAGDGPEARSSEAGIRLGTYRDLWAAEVAERSPALRFLVPEQTLELAPADAQRLELRPGDRVEVATNGTSVTARVALRERMRPGAGFLIEGLGGANANLLDPREPVTLRRLEEGG